MPRPLPPPKTRDLGTALARRALRTDQKIEAVAGATLLSGRLYTPRANPAGLSLVDTGGSAGDGSSVSVSVCDTDVLVVPPAGAGRRQVVQLSHIPIDDAPLMWWHPNGGAGIRWLDGSHYTCDDEGVVTIPADPLIAAGDRFTFWYPYVDLDDSSAVESGIVVDWGSSGWSYLPALSPDDPDANTANYAAAGFDDSAWAVGSAPFGNYTPGGDALAPRSTWDSQLMWARRRVTIARSTTVRLRIEDWARVYVDGTLVLTTPEVGDGAPTWPQEGTFTVDAGQHVIAIRAANETPVVTDNVYLDCQIEVLDG